MNAPIVAASIAAIGTLESAVPLVWAIELSGADWTPAAVGLAAAGVLTAAATGTVLVINAFSAMNRKQDEIIKTTTKTHEAANSTLSAANAAKELLLMEFKGMQEAKDKEIEGLKRQISEMDKARTAAVAATTPATVPSAATPHDDTIESIKETGEDTNTIVKKDGLTP